MSTGNSAAAAYLAGWAGKNITPGDVNTIRANMMKMGGNPNVWGPLNNPSDVMAAIKNGQVAAAGAGTTIQPTPVAPGPNLEPQVAPLASAARGGERPVGAPPGAVGASEAVGHASGAQYSADLLAANSYKRSVYPLEQAIPALESLGQTGTGPGTDQVNQIKSFLLSWGAPGVDVDKIKNYDEANKYLTDYVNQTGNTGTNDKLAAAFSGNPSTHISNAAAVDVAKSALALRRMQQAQVTAFQETGLPDSAYSRWVSRDWATKVDPRAFGFDLMTPQAQQKLVTGLDNKRQDAGGLTERQRFIRSLQAAHAAGVVNPPAGAQPAPSPTAPMGGQGPAPAAYPTTPIQ